MASQSSFDVSTGADLQEVDNAVNQAIKEVGTRYDFRGSNCTIEFKRDQAMIDLEADDEFKMKSLFDIVQSKLIRRNVPVKNLDIGSDEEASGGRIRRSVGIKQSIPQEVAKKMVKDIKQGGFKKVQAAIQGDEVRVSSGSRDELQAVIAFLKQQDYDLELQFGNYR